MKDKEVSRLIGLEKARQSREINLIASENFVSEDVLTALGSAFTNKYAEGYPGKRYYGGNGVIDELELLTQKRALALFGLSTQKWSVNVQALSGSPANLSVYLALAPIGARIMGLELNHGGHLTHGHSASVTGKLWKQIAYTVDKKTELLDYNELKKRALKTKPHILVAGYTAYPRLIDWKKMHSVARASGAFFMVDLSHLAGLVAGGAYSSPFAYADVVTMTTHKTLRGPRAALIFSKKDSQDLGAKIDRAVFPGLQGGPHMNTIAAVAIALKEAQSPAFKKYARQTVKNARALAGELTRLGWRLVSGGTDSHLLLIDTWAKGISGGQASKLLEKVGIIVNKNMIPFDARKPTDPSGIRLGTAALTTQGKKEKDMIRLAQKITKILTP